MLGLEKPIFVSLPSPSLGVPVPQALLAERLGFKRSLLVGVTKLGLGNEVFGVPLRIRLTICAIKKSIKTLQLT